MISLCGLSWNNLILSPEPRGWRKTSLLSISRTVTGRSGVRVLIKSNKNLLNWEKDGGVAIKRNRNDLWWMWDDVALCERRRCPLSQSTGKLRGAGAPHGWVGGQGATHCVGLTGGPWVNTASRRRLGGWGCSGRPPTQAINLIRDDRACIPPLFFCVLFPCSNETDQWVVMSACLVSFWPRRTSRRQTHCYSSLLTICARLSPVGETRQPSLRLPAPLFRKKSAHCDVTKITNTPWALCLACFWPLPKVLKVQRNNLFLFFFWRGERYYHKIIHKINHEIPIKI